MAGIIADRFIGFTDGLVARTVATLDDLLGLAIFWCSGLVHIPLRNHWLGDVALYQELLLGQVVGIGTSRT